jgi:hypothetical protein
MSENSQAWFTAVVDQLWSEGKEVKNLHNLKDMVQKLSASVRRDELLTQINRVLDTENPVVLIDIKEYQGLLALDYSVEHWTDLVRRLAQANLDRAQAVSNMEYMQLRLEIFERAEACRERDIERIESEKRNKEHARRESDGLFFFLMRLGLILAPTLFIYIVWRLLT